jgi:O-antigen ligase
MTAFAATLRQRRIASEGLRVPLTYAGAAFVAALAAAFSGLGALAVPVGIVAIVWLWQRPVALLAAYLAIGVFKGVALIASLPLPLVDFRLDSTLVLAAVLSVVCAVRVVTGRALKIPMPLALTVVVLGLLLVISLMWTPVLGYGAEKALRFWTLTLLAIVAPFCVVENVRDLRALLGWTLAIALLGAVVVLAFGDVVAADDINNANTGRLEFGGVENTIFTSRLLCGGAVVAFFVPALGFGGRWGRVLGPLAAVGLLAVAASIGSRGPLVALVLAFVVTLTAVVLRNPRALVPLVGMVAIGVVVLSFVSLPETSAARLRGITQDPLGTLQADGRSRLYRQAIEITKDHPVLGFGSGGFNLYSAVIIRKELRYPHNIFLEAAAEIGVAAAIVLAACIVAVLIGLFRRAWATEDGRRRAEVYTVTALLLLTFFAAQFSGDINDNRSFWTALALGWLVSRHELPGPVRPGRA